MKYCVISVLLICLSGCAATTTTTYDKGFAISDSVSETIQLSFRDTKSAPFYFILMSSTTDGTPRDLLKVRWINPDKYHRQFKSLKSTIRFIINKEKILTILPQKEPLITAYDVNKGTCEEEIVYPISRKDIEEIAHAKTVEVELEGRDKVVIGKFNKWHSFRGFKNFLKNT